jgi:hypothetical protein
MKTLITAFVISLSISNAYCNSIEFSVWVKPVVHADVNYVENGKRITVPAEDPMSLKLHSCMNDHAQIGVYGKHEATAMKITLNLLQEIQDSPIGFKAKKVSGCPDTKEYFVIPEVVVSAKPYWEDINSHAAVCNLSRDYLNECLVKIDQIDNGYQDKDQVHSSNFIVRMMDDLSRVVTKNGVHYIESSNIRGSVSLQ